MVLPGFLILLLNVYWICFIVAMICARFRDMVPIITSCVQIAFFITPISWMPRLLDQNPSILKYNPLTYLLEIVRAPLLGQAPAGIYWEVSITLALVGCAISFVLFSLTRNRIAFWVD
jgi:lipopolysaccharide transport system permease protein